MKSAFEKALERFGPLREIPSEVKEKLAEIDRIYQAKEADLELKYSNRIKQAQTVEERESLRQERLQNLQALREEWEKEKEKVRKSASKESI